MGQNKSLRLTLTIYATAMLALMGITLLFDFGCFDMLSSQWRTVIGNVLPQIGIMLGIPLLILLCKRQPVLKQVAWRRISLHSVFLVVILGICLCIINNFVASFFGSILQITGYQFRPQTNVFTGYSGLVIELVLSAVLPAICEEFLHRGVLLKGLIPHFGVRRALLYSSLLFGLMHMNVGQFFYATILGWLLGTTALATGSLWGSIIVHFMNNALATYLSYSRELPLFGADVLFGYLTNPITFVIAVVLAFLITGSILRYLAKQNFEKHLDTYTVRYLASQKQFGASDFDQLKTTLPKVLQTLPTWKATAAYIETFDVPKRPEPLTKALLTGLIVFGVLITGCTYVWGTW